MRSSTKLRRPVPLAASLLLSRTSAKAQAGTCGVSRDAEALRSGARSAAQSLRVAANPARSRLRLCARSGKQERSRKRDRAAELGGRTHLGLYRLNKEEY